MSCDCWLADVGFWTVLIIGGFVAFCCLGILIDGVADGVRWLWNRW